MDRMINSMVNQTDALLEGLAGAQMKSFYVFDLRDSRRSRRFGPFESRMDALAKREELARMGLKENETPSFAKLVIEEADFRLGTQGTTQKIPPQKGTDMTDIASLGKGKEALKQPKVPAQAGDELPKAKATGSQKKGENGADGDEDIKKEATAPKDTPEGTEPKQAGKDLPDAALAKSVKKVGGATEAVDYNKQQGDDPTKKAGATKATDNAGKEIGDVEDQSGDKKKKNEAKINEQPEEEEPAEEPAADAGEEVTDAPGDIKPPETKPEEAAAPEQEYFGSKGDLFYYIKRAQNDSGTDTDLILVDADGSEILKATDKGIDPADMLAFVKEAIQEVSIDSIAFEIVSKYILPKLEDEDEEEEEEKEEAEEEAKEEPKEEEEEKKEEKTEEGKVPATPTAASDKTGKYIADLTEEETKEGKVPKIPFDSEDKLIKDLYEKYNLS